MEFDPFKMTGEKHEALVAWLAEEGLDPADISAERFRVHKGRVSGYLFPRNDEGKKIIDMRNRSNLKVPFNQEQKNPLPEVLI